MDALTLPQLDDLLGYWKKNRPLHLMVKDLLGEETTPEPDAEPPSIGELHSIAGMYAQ